MLTILYTCIRARMYTTWLSQTPSTQTVTDRIVSTVTNTCSTLLQANNGSTCTSWTPTEHTLIKSQSQQRISHIPVNVQSTCTQFAINFLFVTQFYLQSTCTQSTINLLFAKLQLQLVFKLPAICNQLALCLQPQLAFTLPTIYHQTCFLAKRLQLAYTLPANLQSVALSLQPQLAYKLPVICNPLLFVHNFKWHSNCLQFTTNLLFASLQLQVAFKLPAICNLFLFAYSTGIQIACNLQSTCSLQNYFNWHSNCLQFAIRCSCLQLQLAYQLPTICTLLLFAYNFQRSSKAHNL